jgi:hypothetical protein
MGVAMKKFRSLSILLACVPYFASMNVSAANYSITFFEFDGVSTDGFNLNDDYVVSGTATFEINDAAVSPNNLVLFSDSTNFLAFDAVMTTTLGNGQFTLGIDDFPPRDSGGSTTNPAVQGILFDASGQPLRFDNPNTTTSNTAVICDPSCGVAVGSRAALTLWDEDGFNRVFLEDGTITTSDVAIVNGDPFTPFNGTWQFNPLDSIGLTSINSYYLIETTAVPIPAAVWLFGSGILGLIGIARRKKAA